MGVYLHLDILPDRISSIEWTRAYEDSLRLLRAWPGALIRLWDRSVRGHVVLQYTATLESGEGLDRRWRTDGDRRTLRTAETHEMFASLSRYQRSRASEETDVLVAAARDQSARVLENKTQGEPYRTPLLAVALLFEDRFPQAALAGGDIDVRDVDQASAFFETVFGRRPAAPVRLDRARLIARLEGRVPATELDDAVDALYCQPMSRHAVGLMGDLLGVLRANGGAMDPESLRDLVGGGNPATLKPMQRTALHAVVWGAVGCVRRLELAADADRLEILAALLERGRLPLTDLTWEALESAEAAVLELSIGLMLLPSPPLHVWIIRRALLENPSLRAYATALSTDRTTLAKVERDMKRVR